jgi:hypothetical protein
MSSRYELTPEHRAQLGPWAARWIANAMSTQPMDEADRDAMRVAIEGMYRAAKLEPPPRDRIVFVPSPFALRFAGGFAAAVWWLGTEAGQAWLRSAHGATDTRDAVNDATDSVTRGATLAATVDAIRAASRTARGATDEATVDAVRVATRDATATTLDAIRDATRGVVLAATRAATSAVTRSATDAATVAATVADDNRWWRGLGDMVALATEFGPADFLLRCAAKVCWPMWDGGNQWSAWPAYVSFLRHVVQLPIDYSHWQHYEAAAIHGGPRVMHKEFCIVSDRPEVLTVDDRNRPHNDTGPFCRWRDGMSLYAVHGVYVPWWIIEDPERVTIEAIREAIRTQANTEILRVMLDREW